MFKRKDTLKWYCNQNFEPSDRYYSEKKQDNKSWEFFVFFYNRCEDGFVFKHKLLKVFYFFALNKRFDKVIAKFLEQIS
jgi:hypothetical protein